MSVWHTSHKHTHTHKHIPIYNSLFKLRGAGGRSLHFWEIKRIYHIVIIYIFGSNSGKEGFLIPCLLVVVLLLVMISEIFVFVIVEKFMFTIMTGKYICDITPYGPFGVTNYMV